MSRSRYELITDKNIRQLISEMVDEYNEYVRQNVDKMVIYLSVDLIIYLQEFRPLLYAALEHSGVSFETVESFKDYKYEFDISIDTINDIYD